MVERRLAAIMVMDVVGYSRLMGADEMGTLVALNAHRRELIDSVIAAHRGRLVKTTGDGLLLEFASVVDAIACAVAIQRGMLSRNAQVSEERRIVFRIGVNIGDIIIDGEDIFGDGVNVAARLESLCEPGGVCISRAANEQIRDKLSLSFADLGEHMVKNIARAVGVFGLMATDIATLPEIPVSEPRRAPAVVVDRSSHKRMTIGIGASVAVMLAIAAGGSWWLARGGNSGPAPDIEQSLVKALAESAPGTSPKYRENTASAFAKLGAHRAIALAPHAEGTWRSGDWPTRELAEEKVLEKCQLSYDEPCVVLGTDDAVSPAGSDRTRAIRDMPRVRYAGLFNPERLPGVREKDQQRPDVAGYATSLGPKAIAYHANGNIFVVTNAPSQRAAEEQALRACNDRPHTDAPGPCFLYAAGNRVVLPLRSTMPITPAPPSGPVAAPSSPSTDRFRSVLSSKMATIAPSQPAAVREAQIEAYQNSSGHKAIAVFPPANSWRRSGLGTQAAAEAGVLEGCEARFGGACVLVAVDETLEGPVAADGSWPRRAMARTEYDGLFDPQQIPAIDENVRRRSDVADYRGTQGAKAAAFHPWGRIFIASGTPTQREAEEQALAQCNADPQRNGQDGSCLLYSVGDQVILPKRMTAPMSLASPMVK